MHFWRFFLLKERIIAAEGCLFFHGGVALTAYQQNYGISPILHEILTFESLSRMMERLGDDYGITWIDVPSRYSREINWIREAGLPDPPEEAK